MAGATRRSRPTEAPELGGAQGHPADRVLAQLSEAFANKDEKAITSSITDPWSGLRHCATWNEALWQSAAKALRGAKFQSGSKVQAVYEVTLSQSTASTAVKIKNITIELHNGRWALDLNSFLGPFPHMR